MALPWVVRVGQFLVDEAQAHAVLDCRAERVGWCNVRLGDGDGSVTGARGSLARFVLRVVQPTFGDARATAREFF
jgi:phosphotransacetylase